MGRSDILVNNAGVVYAGDLFNFNEDEVDRMWRTNVKGVVYCTAAAATGMIENKYGRVINLASIAALGTAYPGTTFYAATKAAVIALTKRFSYELRSNGITVNAVLPGLVITDMPMEGKSPEERQRMIDRASGLSMTGAGRPTGRHCRLGQVSCFRGIRLHDRPVRGLRRRPHGLPVPRLIPVASE